MITKSVIALSIFFLVGCTNEDRQQTREDSRKVGQDLKHDVKKADEVVTKELKDAREKVQKSVNDIKK